MCPDVDDLVIAFVVRNEPHAVVVEDFFNLFVPFGNELGLLLRNDDIVKVE